MTDFVNHFLQYMQFYENNSILCQEHLKILIGGGEGKEQEEGKVDKPNIHIYGARNKKDIYNITDKGWAIVKANKIQEILQKKEKENSDIKAVFYDDTSINVDEMNNKKLKNITAKNILQGNPRYIEENKTIWDDIEELNYNTIFFDFDLTLSDRHSGGIYLDSMLKKDKEKDKEKDEPYKFMDDFESYDKLKSKLLELAKQENTEIYIISRGLVKPLIKAFEELGFTVKSDFIGGKTIDIRNIKDLQQLGFTVQEKDNTDITTDLQSVSKTVNILNNQENIDNIAAVIMYSKRIDKNYELFRDPKKNNIFHTDATMEIN